tara:strand:+ start:904 stop:1398 length:495 start_codon:yes stop_codon:yes gene_type:complete
MENTRSFKIINIDSYIKTVNKRIGGRYISEQPYNAGLKAFNHILRDITDDIINFKITIKETTRKSQKKEFVYDFTRYEILRPIIIKKGKKMISFQYKTTSKKMTDAQYQRYKIKQKSSRVKCSTFEKEHPYLKTCCNKNHTTNFRSFESCKKQINKFRNPNKNK